MSPLLDFIRNLPEVAVDAVPRAAALKEPISMSTAQSFCTSVLGMPTQVASRSISYGSSIGRDASKELGRERGI